MSMLRRRGILARRPPSSQEDLLEPELVSITDAGTATDPALPDGWQAGDLLVVSSTHQNVSTIDIAGFTKIVDVSGGSTHRFNVHYRVLQAADGPLDITYNHASRRGSRLLLFRDAQIARDGDNVPLVSTVIADGTHPAEDRFDGVAFSIVTGSNFNDTGEPVITDDDGHVREWYVNLGSGSIQTWHVGYVAEIEDEAAEFSWTWVSGGDRRGMGRVLVKGAVAP